MQYTHKDVWALQNYHAASADILALALNADAINEEEVRTHGRYSIEVRVHYQNRLVWLQNDLGQKSGIVLFLPDAQMQKHFGTPCLRVCAVNLDNSDLGNFHKDRQAEIDRLTFLQLEEIASKYQNPAQFLDDAIRLHHRDRYRRYWGEEYKRP